LTAFGAECFSWSIFLFPITFWSVLAEQMLYFVAAAKVDEDRFGTGT